MDIQARLGSDIAMVLDECLAYPATRDAAAASMTAVGPMGAAVPRSASSSCSRHPSTDVTVSNPGQAQFGIVQGGVFPGPAGRERRRDRRDRVRGLCHRRAQRRRADRPDVRSRRGRRRGGCRQTGRAT